MTTPLTAFDTRNIAREVEVAFEKAIKGVEIVSSMDEIDVGTAPKDLVFEEDKLRLYHYRPETDVTCEVPVLIVYALVNRQYMLDLQPDRSLVRNLLRHGLDLYIVDWGYPTKADMYITLDDYIDEYMDDCVEFVRKKTGHDKISLMGICQGGTFCAMYSALYPEKIQNLLTLVAPFDFETKDGLLFSWSRHMDSDKLASVYRVVPGEFLNAGFLMMMPFTLNVKKYVEMLDIMEDREKLLNFLRMEKWIFDSPGQAGACYSRFIKELYQENRLVKGGLTINRRTVDLKKITMPLLNIYARNDHLVPPSATTPLNDLVGSTDKSLYEFKGGHIGVFVGAKSQKELAPRISHWLHDHSKCKVVHPPVTVPLPPETFTDKEDELTLAGGAVSEADMLRDLEASALADIFEEPHAAPAKPTKPVAKKKAAATKAVAPKTAAKPAVAKPAAKPAGKPKPAKKAPKKRK